MLLPPVRVGAPRLDREWAQLLPARVSLRPVAAEARGRGRGG